MGTKATEGRTWHPTPPPAARGTSASSLVSRLETSKPVKKMIRDYTVIFPSRKGRFCLRARATLNERAREGRDGVTALQWYVTRPSRRLTLHGERDGAILVLEQQALECGDFGPQGNHFGLQLLILDAELIGANHDRLHEPFLLLPTPDSGHSAEPNDHPSVPNHGSPRRPSAWPTQRLPLDREPNRTNRTDPPLLWISKFPTRGKLPTFSAQNPEFEWGRRAHFGSQTAPIHRGPTQNNVSLGRSLSPRLLRHEFPIGADLYAIVGLHLPQQHFLLSQKKKNSQPKRFTKNSPKWEETPPLPHHKRGGQSSP